MHDTPSEDQINSSLDLVLQSPNHNRPQRVRRVNDWNVVPHHQEASNQA